MKPSDKELEDKVQDYLSSIPRENWEMEKVDPLDTFKAGWHAAIAHMQEQHEKELYKVNLDKQSYNEYYLMLVAKIDSLTTQNEIMEKAIRSLPYITEDPALNKCREALDQVVNMRGEK